MNQQNDRECGRKDDSVSPLRGRVHWDSGVGGLRRGWMEERDMETEPSEDVLSAVIQEYAECFLRK